MHSSPCPTWALQAVGLVHHPIFLEAVAGSVSQVHHPVSLAALQLLMYCRHLHDMNTDRVMALWLLAA